MSYSGKFLGSVSIFLIGILLSVHNPPGQATLPATNAPTASATQQAEPLDFASLQVITPDNETSIKEQAVWQTDLDRTAVIAFVPDGTKLLASGCLDMDCQTGATRIWDTKTAKRLKTLELDNPGELYLLFYGFLARF